MILTVLFAVTAAAYLCAGGLFLAYLARDGERLSKAAFGVLGGAVVAHLGFLAVDYFVDGNVPFADIHQALAMASLLVALGYLAVSRGKSRLRVLGAFVTPITLLLFLGAGFRRGVAVVGEGMRSAILPAHVAFNVLGLVAFALAAGSACAYLLQDRQLRRKQLGGLFRRLPPLDVLDHLSFRLVVVGFVFLTGGMLSGTFWAVRLDPDAPAIGATQTFGVLTWVVFAAVLFLRAAVGWRGRRGALGTLLGFLCACVVLVGYVLRGAGGS